MPQSFILGEVTEDTEHGSYEFHADDRFNYEGDVDGKISYTYDFYYS